jgi:hypothetical protein
MLGPKVQLGTFPASATGPGGYEPPPVKPSQLAVLPAKLPGLFAAALDAYAANGSLASGLTRSDFGTAHQCWAIENLRADVLARAKRGITETVIVSPSSPPGTSVFSLDDHSSLVLFNLDISSQLVPAQPGAYITLTRDPRHLVGYTVPAGHYSSIKFPEQCALAVVDPLKVKVAYKTPPAPRVVGAICGIGPGSGKPAGH